MKAKKPIESLILNLRNQKVILDADLAELYDVPTYRFNEAFKRNRQRFPDDFVFQLRAKEFAGLRSQMTAANSSQIAMSSSQAIGSEGSVPNWSQFVTNDHAEGLSIAGAGFAAGLLPHRGAGTESRTGFPRNYRAHIRHGHAFYSRQRW